MPDFLRNGFQLQIYSEVIFFIRSGSTDISRGSSRFHLRVPFLRIWNFPEFPEIPSFNLESENCLDQKKNPKTVGFSEVLFIPAISVSDSEPEKIGNFIPAAALKIRSLLQFFKPPWKKINKNKNMPLFFIPVCCNVLIS